jgi:formamidopyrimidine-DNA glycosylase
MPELPEVEITRRMISPYIVGKTVQLVLMRNLKLRRPVSAGLAEILPGQVVQAVERRGKFLLVRFPAGTMLLHLGMSGHLHVVSATVPTGKHDHLDIIFRDGLCLRLNDPRRFGVVLWTRDDPFQHPLLAKLGPEPLEEHFSGDYLFKRSRSRKIAAKPFIMDGRTVAGVGNIYANEALFQARINPFRSAGSLSAGECGLLAAAIREVLIAAITKGGATLNELADSGAKPGYFPLHLNVYGRTGEPCPICGDLLQHDRLGGRSTYFCAKCQKQ